MKRNGNILLFGLIGAFIIVFGLLIWVLVRPSPTPPPPVDTSDAWARVQTNGRIVVGTSADYPPFESYDANFALTGFDIALMNEIGQRLNIPVVFRDMVFDDLGNALQLDQIDAAISAISVTTERDQVVDFSTVYYVGSDAVLAQAASPIVINQLQDLAAYRVGVQQATVYQNEVQGQLVDTGLMPPQNLFVYQRADTAVADLTAGRIDLVLLDSQPAQVAVGLGGVKIVGQGLTQQMMAIAVKNGQTNLQNKLNETLAAMQREGRIAQLALDFMGIPPEQILPPPTPVPSATAVPTATPQPCTDGMAFVADLNLNDNNMQNPPPVNPGTAFQKGWRIRNTGTCVWQTNYYLLYVDGNTPAAQMGGRATFVTTPVQPGQTFDMWVSLVAPLTPGVYQGIWAMHNAQGRAFGDRVWVGITVPAPATATPRPTQTPSGNIQFTANQTQITAGQCVTFNWNVTGASAVFFYAAGQPWQSNQVPPQGSRAECPPLTTYYELRVTWPNGSQEIREIVITVLPVVGAPVIQQFTLNPPTQIFAGQCVSIGWAVSGNVTNVSILRNDAAIYGNAPVSGTSSDCPPGAGTMIYSIVATGSGGTSRQQLTLNVILPATQPPPPTATPQVLPPVINSFSVRPGQIVVGGCVDVTWSVGGQANLIQIMRNGVVVLDNAGYNGAVNECLNTPGAVTYRIEASNQAGGFVFQDAQVVVEPATQPGVPLVGTTWQLTDYWDGQGATVAALPGVPVTAVFGPDSVLTGSGGCNTYNAGYSLLTIPGSMTINQPTATNMICTQPETIMTQEQIVLGTLPTITSYQITNDRLELRDSNGRVVLWYVAGATPR